MATKTQPLAHCREEQRPDSHFISPFLSKMSEEIGQGDHGNADGARAISAQSVHKHLSPVPFTDVEEVDNVQTTILSENEGEKSAETPESTEEKLSDAEEDGNEDYLANESEFTEEELIDTTQIHDNGMPSDHHNLSAEPVESTKEELHDSDHIATNEDRGDNTGEISQQSLSREESVLVDAPYRDGDDSHQPSPDTPDSDTSSRRSASAYTPSYEEFSLLLEQLHEERANAMEHNKKLQMKLAPVLAKKSKEELERILQGPMQALSYEHCLEELTELKDKVKEERATAEWETKVLRALAEDKLSKVDKEWQDLLSLKKDAAVTVLNRRMAKADALVRVESVLKTERMYQAELTRVRLDNLRMENRIRRLKSAITEADRNATNPFQREYERLHAKRTERKKYVEKQTEEALRVQKRVVRSQQMLSDIKKTIHCIETEIQHKYQELARLDAIIAQKRDALGRIKHAHKSLQKDNVRLKENCGLLGNEVLLRDYDRTTKANAVLQEKLKNLKYRQADLQFYLGRGRKRLEAI